jgi:hypothetical protein
MRKEVRILALLSVMLIVLVPLTSAAVVIKPIKTQTTAALELQAPETTQIVCQVGKQKIVKEMPVDTIKSIIALGQSKKDAFITIYNKYATQEDVDKSFAEVQPFFNALVVNGLTDKSVDDLNTLYHNIRDLIKKPKRDPSGPQPCGSWNGLPTPVFGNAACGVFTASSATGFVLGTHTFIPTIGVDLFITWAGTGETVSIGTAGFTTSTGPEFGLIFGFAGILIATPIMIIGPLFITGVAGIYLGISPAPGV